jgi:serine protein kinase
MKLVLKDIAAKHNTKTEEMSLEEYFLKASKNPTMYDSPAKRLLRAIGPPEIVDTSKDQRLARVFSNRTIKLYKPFSNFFGAEDVIEKIVSYLEHSSQGLEEKRQILYLLGPVGGGKSSLAEKLKELMEQEPFYAIKGSPIFENPLGLLRVYPQLADNLPIPKSAIPATISPWLSKRIDELEGDLSKIKVIKMFPSQRKQVSITKTEPGDENNQDISTLVGKLDIRKLEHFAQDDPDAYRYNGGLCLGNRGMLEFVEMFKAPLKVLNPLLTATQEGNYKATEALAAIPFDGMIVSHSNESEWQAFKDNKQNEAFLDRIYIVKVPYNLRYEEEKSIYTKYMSSSSLSEAPTAPHTLDVLAKFAVMTRLEPVANVDLVCKLKSYNGDNVKERYPNAMALNELKDIASLAEGFSGLSTRTAFKLLSRAYNYDTEEKAANPVHLFSLISEYIRTEEMSEEKKEYWSAMLTKYLIPSYIEKLRKDIQVSYLDSYSDYGQHLFDRYLSYADAWTQENDFRDPDTGQIYDRKALDSFLEEIEKPAGIANPKDFRHEVVTANLRHMSRHKGKNISWQSNDRIREVLEKKLFTSIDDILPQISFEKGVDSDDAKKQKNFIERMKEKGYTERQVRLVVTYFQKYSTSR